jgi:benzoyl-CoA reductase/2-hydroxyglutaryl-CoA dehydratase subunit BcrC/BadD/HgdB
MQVFYTSPWVPPEFIKAHGLEPRGVWFASDSNKLPLAAGVCAFAQMVVRLAEARTDSAFIFSTHCDQLRRGFDVVAPAAPGRVFLFNLPATWQTAVAERIFGSELERLGRFLVRLGGQPPTAEELAESMARYRLARSRLLEAATHVSPRQYCEALARFHWDGTVNLSQEVRAPRADSISLAVVGGPLPPWQGHVLDAIESAGGRVVLNATEAGERSLGPAFRPDQGHTADRTLPGLHQLLTRSCLDNCVDVFQRPNTRLFLWLKERLAARQVRGIVLWHFVGCDLWRAEAQPLREAFGLPVLLLDANEAAGDALRRSGRIQAFLESLR